MKTTIFYFLLSLTLIACNSKTASSEKVDNTTTPKKDIQKSIIDLSHTYSSETIYWVTSQEFKLDTVYNGQTDKGYYYSANNFCTAEHGGTHIDAPIHFVENGQTVDEIALEKLIGNAVKIDVYSKAINNPNYLVSIEDLKAWEISQDMTIPEGSIVLLQTGFSKYYPDKIKYLGTDKRGEDAIKLLHFPGLSPDAAKWLIQNRNIKSIGIDTPSIDYGQSESFESHIALLEKNIPVFENLTNLDKLPLKGFEIIALPMKIEGGSGAPLRIIAMVNDRQK
ncbi:cyclase family protein [Flavivirga sp. 57AJ16]|uniref:cyclase family protein n=1 Tax=Flavivirga sp. 57AJ16 TaxID=3025307 RepID=UPI002366D18A|nr:cyclase family protein [Flavivirga sp. 57AJ16]MDD7887488.1 cyclase family protein [Flavivirga sp. 57AJ16]